jgi:hypothetical protein
MARIRRALVLGTLTACSAACAPPRSPAAPSTSAPSAAAPTTLAPSAPPGDSSPPSVPTATDMLASERGPMDACYASARAIDPQLGQTSITFRFAIDSAGKPTTVDLQYRHRMDDRAKECLRDAALALSFPPSMQGRQTATLTFRPAP